jgi:hypothetical protein
MNPLATLDETRCEEKFMTFFPGGDLSDILRQKKTNLPLIAQ